MGAGFAMPALGGPDALADGATDVTAGDSPAPAPTADGDGDGGGVAEGSRLATLTEATRAGMHLSLGGGSR